MLFTIERSSPGRKAGKKCVKPTTKNRKKKKCIRYTLVGRFAVVSAAGPNAHRFSGKIGQKKLSPGSYRITLIATDAAKNQSVPRRLTIKIVKK